VEVQVVLAERAYPFEICPEPVRRGAREWVQASSGQLRRHSLACPMLVMAQSGRNSRGFSASCLSRAEPFNNLVSQNPGG
jgi:hypothetical protein